MATLVAEYEMPTLTENEWDAEVVVLGDPVPHGVGRNPKTGDRYVPHRQARHRGDIMDAYLRQAPARGPLHPGEPVELHLRFWIARPKYHYGTGRNATVLKDRYRTAKPTGKPDGTNLQKLAEDALTGVAYADDDQVWKCDAEKNYTEGPARTEIKIRFG